GAPPAEPAPRPLPRPAPRRRIRAVGGQRPPAPAPPFGLRHPGARVRLPASIRQRHVRAFRRQPPRRRRADPAAAAGHERDSPVQSRHFPAVRSVVSEDPISYRSVHILRSEEHTSELQSREKIVCRLLLAKKSKN